MLTCLLMVADTNTMAPTATSTAPSGARNLEGISNYTKFWQKDSKNDGETDTANRVDQYTSVVNGE